MDEMTTRRGTLGELDHWTMRDPRTMLDSLSTMDPRTILLLFVTCCLMGGVAGRPQPPVNITIVQKQTNFVIVSWDVPEGETIIGYAISQQQWKAGQSQRFIKEVNTTARTCTLWDLEPGNEYLLRVQALGLGGLASDPSPVLHFTTHQGSQLRVHGNSTDFDYVQKTMEERQPITGELIIIVLVLVMWAAVIAHFCRQYDIIKDNDSNNKEKTKMSSEESSPDRSSGSNQRAKYSKTPAINIIEV